MRILEFYQYFCTPKGAWGTRHYEFARRWVEAGHSVTIVTSVYDKSDLEPRGFVTELDVEGIRVIAVRLRLSNKHGLATRLLTFAAFSAVGSIYALSEPADVVLASSGPLTAAIPGLVARWFRGRPLVLEIRDLLPEGAIEMGLIRGRFAIALSRGLQRVAYRSASVIVGLSPGMSEGIRRVVPWQKIETLTNAADLELFGAAQVTEAIAAEVRGRFVVLYAGTLGAANAGDEIVDIAAALQERGERDVLIVVIGDGKELEALKARSAALGLETLRFYDKRPKLEVAAWHTVASAVLVAFKPFAILSTTSPNKLFDGLAAGKPIINNTVGWISEMLHEHDAGLSYVSGDVQGGVDCVIRLKNQPDEALRMGRNARQLAETHFSRDELARRYLALLSSCAS